MSSDPLTEEMRITVQSAIVGVCEHRTWRLLALHVRTNHTHAVVAASAAPERVINDFKSYATRALRRAGLVGQGARIWSRHGSTRYLWKPDEVTAAIDYAVNRQGVMLLPKPLVVREL
jgi:REP element-mobilizing transposase RayT